MENLLLENGVIDFKNLDINVQNKIKNMRITELGEIGLSKVGKEYIVEDAEAFSEFINNQETEPEISGEVIPWFKNNNNITLAKRGDYVTVKILDVVERRNRENKKVIGYGFRVMSDKGGHFNFILPSQYFEVAKIDPITLKQKWVVLGTTVTIAGKTGYFSASLSEAEKEALGKIDKSLVKRDTLGRFGFIHKSDGVRYNIAGEADETEVAIAEERLKVFNKISIEKEEILLKEKALSEAKADELEIKLKKISDLKEKKLITAQEFETMRLGLLNKGL